MAISETIPCPICGTDEIKPLYEGEGFTLGRCPGCAKHDSRSPERAHEKAACRDDRGRLRVGAAVGVHHDDRVAALIDAEVDLIVVDTAHAHSKNVIETVKAIKTNYNIEVLAGNVATPEGARDLIDAGAAGREGLVDSGGR